MKHNIFTLILIISFFSASAQKPVPNKSTTDDYYFNFWSTSLDSLINSKCKDLIFNSDYSQQNVLAISELNIHKLLDSIETDLPVKYSNRVEEILSLFLTKKGETSTVLGYSTFLANDFEKILINNNLPKMLKYLPFALTAMNNKVVGKTGAAGLWQLRYSAARKEGLNIDSYIDERRNIQKSTIAAISELAHLQSLYKNWELSLAAYSCGANNVNKSIRRSNNQMNFDSIYALLPDFGRDIVPALTASIILHHYANEFGMNVETAKYKIDLDTLEVSQRLHFIQLNEVLGIDIDTLHFLNPEYKYDIIPAMNEVYRILIPKGYLSEFNLLEDSIYHYHDSLLFKLKKPVILPPPSKNRHYARYEPQKIPDGTALVFYHIKSGDNLGYISEWYDVKTRQIEDWNNIYDPRRLRIGKKIKIYVDEDKKAYYKKIDNMSFAAKQKRNGKTVSKSKKAESKKKDETLGKNWFYHTVKSGESPYMIAKKYDGVSPEDILRWNNIKDAKYIQIGQKLKIKKK